MSSGLLTVGDVYRFHKSTYETDTIVIRTDEGVGMAVEPVIFATHFEVIQ